jgi:hypothetical protein
MANGPAAVPTAALSACRDNSHALQSAKGDTKKPECRDDHLGNPAVFDFKDP